MVQAGDIDDYNSESDPESDEDDQRPPEGLIGKLEDLVSTFGPKLLQQARPCKRVPFFWGVLCFVFLEQCC